MSAREARLSVWPGRTSGRAMRRRIRSGLPAGSGPLAAALLWVLVCLSAGAAGGGLRADAADSTEGAGTRKPAESGANEKAAGRPAALVRAPFAAARKAKQGNRAYDEGRYDDALERYGAAQTDAPELPALRYNVGDVLYKQGRYADAAEEFRRLATPPADASRRAAENAIAADAAHNLGNALFQMKDYQGAVDNYIRSLALRPGERPTQANLELALRRLRLQQQQQQQQQEKKDRAQGSKDQQQQQQGAGQSPEQKSGSQDQKDRQDSGEGERKPGDENTPRQDPSKGDRPDEKREPGKNESDTAPTGGEGGDDPAGARKPEGGERGSEAGHDTKMSRKEAEKLLEALSGDEKKALQRLLREQRRKDGSSGSEKDW